MKKSDYFQGLKLRKEELREAVAEAVGAGKPVALETVDFNDPNRPKTCLEVDFPIVPVNNIAAIEGKGSGALKPIYQVSKWWARRRSTVFRSMLISAATKAPDDTGHAAKLVWDNYYANHQKKGAFSHLKVADIFMGGGTTLVEGSRLGMQMYGNDLNPVAWFVVKQELAKVDPEKVKRLLSDIEAEVKPQIMPFYYCDGPNGEKGTWTHIPTGRVEGADFDPLALTPEQRKDYRYEGPEIIYTFWAKHGPCQVTDCGHRTPIMTNPVMAARTLTVKYWPYTCGQCGDMFDIEAKPVRMAPDVVLFISPEENPFATLSDGLSVRCPHCQAEHKTRLSPKEGLVIEGHRGQTKLGKGSNKKVEMTLLVHPQWLAGSPKADADGIPFGGSAQDDAESTALWNQERASKIRLLEVRGALPETVRCPETGVSFKTGKDGGTVPKSANFTCAGCGTVQPVITGLEATQKTAPTSVYAIQGYSTKLECSENAYGGRFFAPFGPCLAKQYDVASVEWSTRKNTDLANYYPLSAVPSGFNTNQAINHFYTHWWTMFNPRQLLFLAQIIKAIMNVGEHSLEVREIVLAVFQQYVRNQNMFCFWNIQRALEPMFSNNNFHPKMNVIENSTFSGLGRGDFTSCAEKAIESQLWAESPWEIACIGDNKHSEKVTTNDALKSQSVEIICHSATDMENIDNSSVDLIITDPPFGGLLHYSELADFFYVWLRLVLNNTYPQYFRADYSPKSLEAVANSVREPEDPDGFYQRVLTQCWKEAYRILKPGGILAFTFHHSEDEPWVAVLESLFDAGFYLEATYPIRSDETKGEGEFGSKTIEYDIIHVCRKRTEEPTAVSWGRMRREVLADVSNLKAMLENHAKEGLPAADLQVIRRGKALEYFSRHYGKVFKADGEIISVKEALLGINQILDEGANPAQEPPPVTAEPITRQFLRIVYFSDENDRVRTAEGFGIKRESMQKYLRGTGIAPDEFVGRQWCEERSKIYYPVEPLAFARDWQGKHKIKLNSDLDQALVLIGACFDGSGINASDTLKNDNFKPHPALKSLLEWFIQRGATQPMRNAASRALTIYNGWAATQAPTARQADLFKTEEGY